MNKLKTLGEPPRNPDISESQTRSTSTSRNPFWTETDWLWVYIPTKDDPKHSSKLCKDSLTKKQEKGSTGTDGVAKSKPTMYSKTDSTKG